jgi:hypothetical protein
MKRSLPMRRFVGLAATLLLSLNLLAGDKKKKDPEEIGNRDVGKGINFYSLEKEIGLGKIARAGRGAASQDH